jgi:hypothetical protein
VGDWSSLTRSIHSNSPAHRLQQRGPLHENCVPRIANRYFIPAPPSPRGTKDLRKPIKWLRKTDRIISDAPYLVSEAEKPVARTGKMDLHEHASQQARSSRCHQIPIDLPEHPKTNPAISRLSASPTPENASRQSSAARGVRESYITAAIRSVAACSHKCRLIHDTDGP